MLRTSKALLCLVFALVLALPLIATAGEAEAPCDEQLQLIEDGSGQLVFLAPCGPTETPHECDVQDNCTGRHFKDKICCPAGTHGECLVAQNGLGCVLSVDAICVAD